MFLTSPPAQKAPPAPVIMSAFTSSPARSRASFSEASSCSRISVLSAFFASGRFKVMVAICSLTS